MHEQRLIAIEEKIEFQNKLLQELNDVIYRQQKDIDKLETTCQALIDRIKALSDVNVSGPLEDERPPHY